MIIWVKKLNTFCLFDLMGELSLECYFYFIHKFMINEASNLLITQRLIL